MPNTDPDADIAITLDIDWVSDHVIETVADRLIQASVPATWFVTHASPAVDRLQQRPELFEVGIHPNFLPGSTQGDTPEAVLAHCMEIAPRAESMRTHGLVQSTHLLATVMAETPIRCDVSLFVPHAAGLGPVEYWWEGRRLVRIPYVWEDDFEMFRPEPCWDPVPMLEAGGLKVFDFHPAHVFLNSRELAPYSALKARLGGLQDVNLDNSRDLIHTGEGTGTCFERLIDHLRDSGRATTIRAMARSPHPVPGRRQR